MNLKEEQFVEGWPARRMVGVGVGPRRRKIDTRYPHLDRDWTRARLGSRRVRGSRCLGHLQIRR